MAKINFKKIFLFILTLETIIISATIYRYNLPLFPGEKTVNLIPLNTLQVNIQRLMDSKNLISEEKTEGQIQITDEMIRLVSREIEINSVKIKKGKINTTTFKSIAKNENFRSINNDELISLTGFKKEKIKINKIEIEDVFIKEEAVSISSSAVKKEETSPQATEVDKISDEEIIEYDYSKSTSFMDKKLSKNVLKAIERESDKKLVMNMPARQTNEVKAAVGETLLEERFDEYSLSDSLVVYDYEKEKTQAKESASNFLNTEKTTSVSLSIKNQTDETLYRIVDLADETVESLANLDEETTLQTKGDVYSAKFVFNDYPTVQAEMLKGKNIIQLPPRAELETINFQQDKGLIIVRPSSGVQVVGISLDNEKKFYSDAYEKTNEKEASYVVLNNVDVGLFWLKFKYNNQEFKRWININPGTIVYLNISLDEKIERIDLKMKQLIDEDVDLNIQDKLQSLNENKFINKVALNKYQAKNISDKTQKNLIKLDGDKERNYLISYKKETNLIYPGKNIIEYALGKTGLKEIDQACVVFSKPKQGLVRNKMSGYSFGNSMFVDHKYLLKNGDIESEASEAVEWIMIYGEGEGQIFIENEYSESNKEQKSIPCLNNTILIDHY